MNRLTAREFAVWTELSWGRSISETAHTLGLSNWTVKTYLKRIYNKLCVSNRVQMALKFHGLERHETPERPQFETRQDRQTQLGHIAKTSSTNKLRVDQKPLGSPESQRRPTENLILDPFNLCNFPRLEPASAARGVAPHRRVDEKDPR